MTSRLDQLRDIMQQANVDAVALIPGANFLYLTGSTGHASERPYILFVPRQGDPIAAIPHLEADKLVQHFPAKLFSWRDEEGYEGAFQAALANLNLAGKKLGVEGQQMRFFESELLHRLEPAMTMVSIDKELSAFRIIKSAEDTAALRKAIQMSEEALYKTLEAVSIGMTEREITSKLMVNLYAMGGEALSFDPIVLGGANSALPHGSPGDYAIQEGDALLFDFGVSYQGYRADITRTVFVGQPDEHQKAIYEAVKAANEAARQAARPGVTAESLDTAARQALIDAGFEHLIAHRTGHGLGIEIHEHPNIVQGNKQILEPGMVFTIEPGLYEQGVIGVRIEDNVVITGRGSETLTTFPREIMVLE